MDAMNVNSVTKGIISLLTGIAPDKGYIRSLDQKIMELEVHQPTVKEDEILTHVHGAAAAAACLRTSNFTEQRLVRLENNMATILRYLYRIGSRMFINCIYYGGQTTFEKEYIDILKAL